LPSKYFDSRKNTLFVGYAHGGRTAAFLAGLTSTCRHAIDPQLYLTQFLVNLASLSISDRDTGYTTDGKRVESTLGHAQKLHPANLIRPAVHTTLTKHGHHERIPAQYSHTRAR
jgi:hypothetical protein